MRTRLATVLLTAFATGVPAGHAAPTASAADRAVSGVFSAPFEEAGPKCANDASGKLVCKPAGVALVPTADGTVLYWDGLEGMESVKNSVVGEFGGVAQNDQSRVLDLRGPGATWDRPAPNDGGANPGGNNNEYLPVVPHNNDDLTNDGSLFCSDQVHLADGRVLTVGGTSYYLEPGVSGVPYGLSELEGVKNARIYDPVTRRFQQSGSMRYGRWYPSLVTLPDGKVFVASGVTKLVKPLYPDRPADSGTNVKQTELFDPATGTWAQNPASADRSLPLYPRLHLLPNGKIYYDAGGQTFNPQGQSYDEALWNLAAIYDPATRTWTDKGLPAFGPVLKGFRGSGFSQMLSLRPPYTQASFLSAGGVFGPTPGTYLATDTSTLNTVDTAAGDAWTTEATGPLNNARWYSTGVTLPTGQVLAFSGASNDEVFGPGGGFPVTQAELFDPATKTWVPLASGNKGRTYHNTAVLLPDGRVLVGGHSPIATGYGAQNNVGRDTLGLSDAYRDPSFEVFSPPNLFYGRRPVIYNYDQSLGYGATSRIIVSDVRDIASVVLVRNPALTHLVDGDQRVVELPIVGRDPAGVTVQMPTNRAVAPAGPYWLFVNKWTPKGLTPSVSRQVFVGVPAPSYVEKVVITPPAPSSSGAVKARRDNRDNANRDRGKGKKKGHDKQESRDSVPAAFGTAALPADTLPAALVLAALGAGLVLRRRRSRLS